MKRLIDWEELWENQMGRSSWSKNDELWWDRRSEEFDRRMKTNEYIEKMIAKIDPKPESTVLDVGCGPGTLAIPFAKRVKSVTALDMSKMMLQFVMKNARSEGLTNITCLQRRWEEVTVGRNLKPHDLVICSRSFPERSPWHTLYQLNSAARKCVYITMWANGDEYETFYQSIYRNIGKEYRPPPDYIYVYNMLYQEGILANVEFIEYTDHLQYSDIDATMQDWMWRIRPENKDQENRLNHYLLKQFAKNKNSKMEKRLKCRWALIWWKKGEVNE